MTGLTLGELIRELKLCDKDFPVYYDFCDRTPTTFNSDRGNYSELALGHRGPGEIKAPPPFVEEFLALCKRANGATFTGYKGGEFVMTGGTRIHVANWGEYHPTVLVGVREYVDAHRVILLTSVDL